MFRMMLVYTYAEPTLFQTLARVASRVAASTGIELRHAVISLTLNRSSQVKSHIRSPTGCASHWPATTAGSTKMGRSRKRK